MSTPLIVQDLSIRTMGEPPVVLVDSLSFKLTSGKPVLLVGETGAGKSLIAQAVLGNITDDLAIDGQIWIRGTEYLSRPKKARQQLWGRYLGLLPQEPWLSLNPTRRALSQLAEVYQLVRHETKTAVQQIARKVLHTFHLHKEENKFPHELSAGMAQRLAFCCCLAGGAQILIVDEPTKGLDSERKADVIQQLQTFVADGGHLMVITHDFQIAEKLGGETIVLRNGVVQEQKTTRELLARPEAAFTRDLIEAVPANWPRKKPSTYSRSLVVSGRTLSKKYGENELFSDMSIEIHRGEIVGLYGHSGSGKSTLGNILLGLIQPDHGVVKRPHAYRPFQYLKLYQDPPASFSPFHTLKSSMDDFLALHHQPEERFGELMGKLNLDPSMLDRDPANISGGELQRFTVLRALMLDPVFLFADEPTSRLDPITQKETIDLICTTTRRINCGVLLVSHNLEMLAKSCDWVVMLD